MRRNIKRNPLTYDRTLDQRSFNALMRSCSAGTTARRRARYSQALCTVTATANLNLVGPLHGRQKIEQQRWPKWQLGRTTSNLTNDAFDFAVTARLG
jgi:hypothetical protein